MAIYLLRVNQNNDAKTCINNTDTGMANIINAIQSKAFKTNICIKCSLLIVD